VLHPPDADSASWILLRCPDRLLQSNGKGWFQCTQPFGRFDLIIDSGELATHGFIMDLANFRWDVLGKVEELLQLLYSSLCLLRPNGCFRWHVAPGQLRDFLATFLTAFGAEIAAERSNGWMDFVVSKVVTSQDLEVVLQREVYEERSHARYAKVLFEAFGPASRSRVLDVGGGDGHMAIWWSNHGCDVHLLEVNPGLVAEAQLRLGQDRVTLHDGQSAWPFADGSFDTCLLLFVLHHIADSVQTTLREAARVAKRVLVLEDQPRTAKSRDLLQLAVQVTAQHFRPFGQDPQVYMQNIRPDSVWQKLFEEAGLHCVKQVEIPGTLQHFQF